MKGASNSTHIKNTMIGNTGNYLECVTQWIINYTSEMM